MGRTGRSSRRARVGRDLGDGGLGGQAGPPAQRRTVQGTGLVGRGLCVGWRPRRAEAAPTQQGAAQRAQKRQEGSGTFSQMLPASVVSRSV